MPITVKLKELVQEMDWSSDESTSWLDLKTGELLCVPEEAFRVAQEPHQQPGLMEDEFVEWAKRILEDEAGYLPLPSRWEINEYQIMEEFIDSLPDETVRNVLYRAIRGKGAFRMFKDRICDLEIRQDWFDYRDRAFRKIAADWCEVNGVLFLED